MIITLLVAAAMLAQTPAAPVPPRKPTVSARKAKAKAAPRQPALPSALPVQVMLDRAGFSPGMIDGKPGRNTEKALAAYTQADREAGEAPVEAVTTYTLTEEDANGPYEAELPTDLMEQSKLTALSYRTPLEALAERFHCSPALLQRLNPRAQFVAGATVRVPNVEALVLPVDRLKAAAAPSGAERKGAPAGRRGTAAEGPPDPAISQGAKPAAPADRPVKPDVVISVSKSMSALTVTDATDRVIFYAPVTTGSEHDPLPIGEWKVKGVQFNPTFRYNPELFWDADVTHTKAVIPAGPNNPVGLVWIDLTKDHYGIHGTPEPATVGRSESHGCVRLTNWDALKLAGLVKPGTRVVFSE